MGRFGYYCPLWLGTAVALLLYSAARDVLPAWVTGGRMWLGVVFCALVGVQCQIFMLGCQGVWAQVLPVPVGRSLRGRSAVGTGVLLLFWVGLGPVAGLFFDEGLTIAAWTVGGLAAVCLLGAILTYVWGLPTAERDFTIEKWYRA